MARRASRGSTARAALCGRALPIALAASATLGGCTTPQREPRPLGALPSAVTSAEPLYLPFAIRAGSSYAADPREAHLRELRRLTFDGRALAASWAPDGRSLVVETRPADGACGAIELLELADGARRRVSGADGWAHSPLFDATGRHVIYAFTPRGAECSGVTRSLAFRAPRPSAGVREWLGPDVGEARASAGDASELAATHEAAQILFTSQRDGNPEIYLGAPDGSGARRISERAGYDGMASMSPDGARVAWHGEQELEAPPRGAKAAAPRAPGLAILVAGSAGQHPVVVVPATATNVGPAFFPDSRRVLFASDRDAVAGVPGAARGFDLYAVDPDGAVTVTGGPALERVTFARGFDAWARFSPDGRHVCFVSSRACPDCSPESTDLYVARWAD